ncbi:unnamed protein product, partial [Phaeothamnion confervicola]
KQRDTAFVGGVSFAAAPWQTPAFKTDPYRVAGGDEAKHDWSAETESAEDSYSGAVSKEGAGLPISERPIRGWGGGSGLPDGARRRRSLVDDGGGMAGVRRR